MARGYTYESGHSRMTRMTHFDHIRTYLVIAEYEYQHVSKKICKAPRVLSPNQQISTVLRFWIVGQIL